MINDEYFLYGQPFSLGVCLRFSFIFLGSKAPFSFLTERVVVFSPAQFIQQSSPLDGGMRGCTQLGRAFCLTVHMGRAVPQEINIHRWTRWCSHAAAGEQVGLEGGEL